MISSGSAIELRSVNVLINNVCWFSRLGPVAGTVLHHGGWLFKGPDCLYSNLKPQTPTSLEPAQ